MTDTLALFVVVLTAIYFLALAAASLLVPAEATRFLLGFAASPRRHFTELFFRLLVGGALVVYAPRMSATSAVSVFGWVLLITTVGLLLLPWRWHRGFAQRFVPPATRYIAIIGLGSLALGVLILVAVIRGVAS